jgi:enoyl-CoA hydratase/carnithine racemase
MDDASDTILVRVDGHIGRFTINNPGKRNAMSFHMWQRMGDALEGWARRDDVRVIIVRGAGDKAFSAGNDISEFGERRSSPEGIAEYNRTTRRAYEALGNIPKPTIARIDGFCVGGGLEISQLCDIQIAADSARFAVTPARLGLGYKLADVLLLTANISAKHTKELLITGRVFDAEEALGMGLVNRVVAAAELDRVVEEYAETIAGNAPLSVKAAKLMVNEATKESARRDTDLCQALVDACHASDDYREGQRAFAEKREPEFRGR